ncbi:mucin-2-like [Ochlerotatus camptorhynchus]|uniref:mucin-2-like n=1 Tax=Ochlerotatus camptorhynchus TaxID=644619 RepID=UPI0031D5B0A3
MFKMGHRVDLSFIIRIWLVLVSIKTSQCENAEPRALDLSVPWRPIPYHVPQQQLISVASFDTTSKDELVHIAQHNAHILKQFNQPITQYQNQNTHQVHPVGGQQQYHQQSHKQSTLYGGHTSGPKYMTTPLLLTNISPAGPMQTTARHAKPFGPKSDQVTTLNLVHSPTPKHVTPMAGHLAPVGVKAAKFNGQFREPVHNAPSAPHQKSTMNPQHPVMNKLQTHMAVGYRQKQPVAATSNRLEHYVNPNHLYGTYIQFGQASSPLQSAKSKFISQLASHPNFDAQLKGLLHAGVGGGYQQTFSQIKNLQKMNYFQQQSKLQPYFNHIPSAEIDLPKKLHSSVEKDSTKTPVTPSTPLFPHIPPSVLTPFFQQVQQQQQNKYGFSLKTQHPAPPAASPNPTQYFQEKPHKHQHQFDSHQVHPTPLQHHGTESFGFTAYQNHQQPPFEHKPHEAIKFNENKHIFNEIRDEYSKNLVPPPPSTQQAFIPTIINHPEPSKDPKEILNKYNIKSHSPLQDANRFNYESYARPSAAYHTPTTTPSTTFYPSSTSSQSPPSTTPRQPFYGHTITFGGDHNSFNSQLMVTPVSDDWIGRDKFITTEKPNVFKNLFRQPDNEYKQHKLMHPSYTGLPPNKRPSPTTPLSTADASTEEPVFTHSFFTIEDAISDPTLIPPNNRNKYKYTTEAEENRLEDSQSEIVTIGSSFLDSLELGTTTPYPMFKAKGRRRRPKPSTEHSIDSDSTESPAERPNRNRFRFRPRPTTEAENELNTTAPPPTSFLSEDSSLKKLRKKLPNNFSRNRLPSNNNRDESDPEQHEHPVTQISPVTTTAAFSTPASLFNFNSDNNGLRSRFRPSSGFDVKPTRTRSKFSDDFEDPFKSSEITRDSENTRLNFKLPNTKPSLRLPSSSPSFGPSTSSTFTSFTSDETSGEVNRTKPELNRPRFSIKEYRNKPNRTMSSTSTTTAFGSFDLEVTTQPATKLRFPTRNRFMLNSRQNKTTESNEVISPSSGFGSSIIGSSSSNNNNSTTTEKLAVANETTTTRTSFRPTGTRNYNRFTVKKATTESPQQQPSSTVTSRVVNRGRIRLQDTTTQATPNRTSIPGTLNSSTLANRRPAKISLRQRIQNYNRKKDSDAVLKDQEQESNTLLYSSDEVKSADDLSTLGTIDTQNRYEDSSNPAPSSTSTSTTTTEGYRHPETAIMKISPKDSSSPNGYNNNNNDGDWDLNSASSDYSKRVVELTLSASKDKGFKSVNKGLLSRRVPGYFTLATEDPILPIEAFFPQVKKVSA